MKASRCILIAMACCAGSFLSANVRGEGAAGGDAPSASRSSSRNAGSSGRIGANVPITSIDSEGGRARGASAEDKPRSHAEPAKAVGGGGGVAAILPRFPAALDGASTTRMIETVVVFGLVSLAPAALLMITAFVRISIVLTLLRQALGNPQIPGNQVLTVLALLLTAIVMRPSVTRTYHDAIEPLAAGEIAPAIAWEIGVKPIKAFMIDQIFATHRQAYLVDFYRYVNPEGPKPTDCDSLPMRVVAPAFLIAELTTALLIGFAIYLPFLVIDLIVSAVLAAMGMFMLPPAQVSAPLKLIVFVLADGWRLVADMLIRSFALG